MGKLLINSLAVNHEKINGDDYKNLIISAAQSLEDSKDEINDLNVFPVPDGDTGSNMSLTVGNAAKELIKAEGMTLDETAEKTAKAMLHGARGNSGVIISLLFRGIARALKNSFECDGVIWAEALRQGVEAAYDAVEHPAEGTILTVARKCAEAAEAASKERNDFEYVLDVAINAAESALEQTVLQNPVLQKAGVVDAGGMGWLVVMKAMHRCLKSGVVSTYVPSAAKSNLDTADFSAYSQSDFTFAFCTEFIIKKQLGVDSTDFKAYLDTMGDSLVMIDDGEIIKVHIHTNDPHGVLGEALKYGEYENVKVENMRTQHTNKLEVSSKTRVEPPKKYGFVAVASGKGLSQLLGELGVDRVVEGGQTMNPSCHELYKCVEEVNAKTVFILPNNKNIIMSAERVAEMTDKEIVVLPTKTVPQGISAMLGFDEGAEKDENKCAMMEMAGGVSTIQVTYAARNSNIDGLDIKEGEYLSLIDGALLSCDWNIENVVLEIGKRIKESGKSTVSIYYGCDVTQQNAQKVQELLINAVGDSDVQIDLYNGGQGVYYYIISAE